MATLRIKQGKKGKVYWADFYYQGKRHVISLKTGNHQQAKEMLGKIQGKIANNTLHLVDDGKKADSSKISVKAFFEKYFETKGIEKKPATQRNEKMYAALLCDDFGHLEISDLSYDLAMQWKSKMLQRPKKVDPNKNLSSTTVHNYIRFFKAAFNEAIAMNHIKENPFRKIKFKKQKSPRRFMHQDEFQKILELIDKDIEKVHVHRHRDFLIRYKNLLIFLVNTGLRISEAVKLTTQDVHMNAKIIDIRDPKNGTDREVPLNPAALECIANTKNQLFLDINVNHASRKFHNYVKKANLSEGIKLHSLRHTFGTNLRRLGYDLPSIAELMGHKDVKTTQIYAKMDRKLSQRMVNALPEGIE